MEHRLILGGEQWLPFARSRVRALKALGNPYADQSFEIDGVSIKVRIEPEHEYIRIGGGGCTFRMDSGVVNVWTINDIFTEAKYRAGEMIVPIRASIYNAKFSIPASGPNSDGALTWRVSPKTTSSAGQLSGQVRYSGVFTGKVQGPSYVPDVTPPSFSPARISVPATPPDTNSTWVNVASDESLLMKKQASVRCPASMFTGRTRLYVQALYGRYLRDDTTKGQSVMPFGFTLEAQGRPALALTPRPQGSQTFPNVPLTTSSGVYLDVSTGNHWLFNPGDGKSKYDPNFVPSDSAQTQVIGTPTVFAGVAAYPLKATSCGEGLRRYLRVPKVSENNLSDEDIEHLEAYILSESVPVYTGQVYVPISFISPGAVFSMGYGWHWNWTGLKAVLVINDQYAQNQDDPSRDRASNDTRTPTYSAMKSTKYDLTMGRTGVAAFNCSITSSGEERWTVERDPWTILSPFWLINGLDKLTPHVTQKFACNATFYAFYKKDELIECKVQLMRHDPVVPSYTCTPEYFDDVGTGMNNGTTVGLEGGGSERVQGSVEYWEAKFSVGADTRSELYWGKTAAGWKTELSGKTKGVKNYTFSYNITGGTNLTYGTPTYNRAVDPRWVWPIRTYDNWLFIGGYARSLWDGTYNCTFDYTVMYFEDSWSSLAEVIVPSYDAEAVYLRDRTWKNRYGLSATTQQRNGSFILFHEVTETTPGGGSFENIEQLNVIDLSACPATDPVPTTPSSSTLALTNKSTLHSRAGGQATLDFYIPPDLHGAEDFILWPAKVLTSASYTDTVVIPDRGVFAAASVSGVMSVAETKGVGVVLPALFEPVIVGWV